jgi:hypothetical protein
MRMRMKKSKKKQIKHYLLFTNSIQGDSDFLSLRLKAMVISIKFQ